jgi:hypothetical protein
MRSRLVVLSLLAGAVAVAGCWDEVIHQAECADTGGTTDTDTDTDADTDSDADAAVVGDGQGDVPAGWEGFGAPCVDDADCNNYPGSEAFPRRCLTDVMELFNAPGGFCTACCNVPAADGCADNIDCVGADLAFTICLAHCDSNEDCRTDEGWECRPIYLVEETFPGNFCLPDEEHKDLEPGQVPDDPNCPWPWS